MLGASRWLLWKQRLWQTLRHFGSASPPQYSINEESDGDEGEYDVNNDLLDGKGDKIEKPIFRGSSKNGGLKNAVYGGGSENSLLEGTDDLIRLTRGMSEDGSFREGRYADGEA